jgi:hypothetical protein
MSRGKMGHYLGSGDGTIKGQRLQGVVRYLALRAGGTESVNFSGTDIIEYLCTPRYFVMNAGLIAAKIFLDICII